MPSVAQKGTAEYTPMVIFGEQGISPDMLLQRNGGKIKGWDEPAFVPGSLQEESIHVVYTSRQIHNPKPYTLDVFVDMGRISRQNLARALADGVAPYHQLGKYSKGQPRYEDLRLKALGKDRNGNWLVEITVHHARPY